MNCKPKFFFVYVEDKFHYKPVNAPTLPHTHTPFIVYVARTVP